MPSFIHENPRYAIGGSLVYFKSADTFDDSGDNTLIAAVTARKIRVHQFAIAAASAVNVYFTTATTAITPLLYLQNSMVPIVFPFSPVGWFETVAGELLGCNLSSGVEASFFCTYSLQ